MNMIATVRIAKKKNKKTKQNVNTDNHAISLNPLKILRIKKKLPEYALWCMDSLSKKCIQNFDMLLINNFSFIPSKYP